MTLNIWIKGRWIKANYNTLTINYWKGFIHYWRDWAGEVPPEDRASRGVAWRCALARGTVLCTHPSGKLCTLHSDINPQPAPHLWASRSTPDSGSGTIWRQPFVPWRDRPYVDRGVGALPRRRSLDCCGGSGAVCYPYTPAGSYCRKDRSFIRLRQTANLRIIETLAIFFYFICLIIQMVSNPSKEVPSFISP